MWKEIPREDAAVAAKLGVKVYPFQQHPCGYDIPLEDLWFLGQNGISVGRDMRSPYVQASKFWIWEEDDEDTPTDQ